jgi:hypothetical protein
MVSVPRITGRYYTVQFLNGWGETVANINERVFPKHPYGEFAVCLKGSKVNVPAGAQRVDVPVKTMRVLSRVELGSSWDEAVELQHKVQFRVIGHPTLPTVPKTPMFDMEALPGVEAFESAELALDSEADINPGMDSLQASTRAIAKAIQDPAERQRVDQVIRGKATADLKKAMLTLGDGTVRNGWVVPSTIGVYGRNWHAYTLHFTKEQLPAQFATHFWSVIAVDAVHRRVLPNPKRRYLLNNQSKLQYGQDGSLTLYLADTKPEGAPDANWLPTPKGQGYSLTFRFYRPKGGVADHTYFPPTLVEK